MAALFYDPELEEIMTLELGRYLEGVRLYKITVCVGAGYFSGFRMVVGMLNIKAMRQMKYKGLGCGKVSRRIMPKSEVQTRS